MFHCALCLVRFGLYCAIVVDSYDLLIDHRYGCFCYSNKCNLSLCIVLVTTHCINDAALHSLKLAVGCIPIFVLVSVPFIPLMRTHRTSYSETIVYETASDDVFRDILGISWSFEHMNQTPKLNHTVVSINSLGLVLICVIKLGYDQFK